MAQSTAEAEYIAAAKAANQVVWLRKILGDLMHEERNATVIMVDNTAAVAIVRNPGLHDKTKHFKIKYHRIRELEQEGEVQVMHCCSED